MIKVKINNCEYCGNLIIYDLSDNKPISQAIKPDKFSFRPEVNPQHVLKCLKKYD